MIKNNLNDKEIIIKLRNCNECVQKSYYELQNFKRYILSQFFYTLKDGTFYYKYTKQQIQNFLNPYSQIMIKSLLKDFDIPYIEKEWIRYREKIMQKYPEQPGRCFGHYLSLMKLNGFKNFTFKDSDELNERYNNAK